MTTILRNLNKIISDSAIETLRLIAILCSFQCFGAPMSFSTCPCHTILVDSNCGKAGYISEVTTRTFSLVLDERWQWFHFKLMGTVLLLQLSSHSIPLLCDLHNREYMSGILSTDSKVILTEIPHKNVVTCVRLGQEHLNMEVQRMLLGHKQLAAH